MKRWYAEKIVKNLKAKQKSLLNYEKNYQVENVKILSNVKSSESQLFYGCDMIGNYLLVKFTRYQHRIAEIWIILRLADGTHFVLPGKDLSNIGLYKFRKRLGGLKK